MITREELYQLVWSKPMIKVAEQFEVSGSYMARVCSVLRVPRPERGYWAKLAVGKAPAQRPLPETEPGDQLTWSKDGDLQARPVAKPVISAAPKVPRLAKPVRGTHTLIQGAKAFFEAGRPVKEGEYLKPNKRLLVDVTTSKECLDKALTFANDLFNALESAGHKVVFAPQDGRWSRRNVEEHKGIPKRQDFRNHWSPHRPTLVYLGTVTIGLSVMEMSEETLMRYVNGKYIREADYIPPKTSRRYMGHSWTTTHHLPCGRLQLFAYSPYGRVDWITQWQETPKETLTKKLTSIVKEIEKSAVDLVDKIKEAERQAEIAHQKWLAQQEIWRQEEDNSRTQKSIKDSKAQLTEIIEAWTDVMNLERFFQEIQDRSLPLPDVDRNALLERLKLAREFVGTQNPLDFFRSWKTPLERYTPLAMRATNTGTGKDCQDDSDDTFDL